MESIGQTEEPSETESRTRVFISAGEHSGDLHASNLIRAMARTRPDLRFEGFGGTLMQEAGCELHENITVLSSMGLSFLSNVWNFFELIRRFYRLVRSRPPAALVLVDFPGFNFILARMAKWHGIPVIYYICPQIWAWAPWRRRKILALTDLLMVIFPFEEEYYRSEESEVVYVGHPLADALSSSPLAVSMSAELRERFSIDPGRRIIGLFPGSRDQEIEALLPIYKKTIEKLDLDPARHHLVLSCCRDEFRPVMEETFADLDMPVDILDGESYPLMAASHLALVASGTATLELAYFETPMVVFYKIGRFAHAIYRLICTSPYVSLVNILGKEEVVPEEVTWRDNSLEQAQRARALLEEGEARERTIEGLARLHGEVFQPGGSERAAATLADFLERRAVSELRV